MKQVFLFAVAAVSLLLMGCNVQPTEINAEDLPDKVTIYGNVRYTATTLKGSSLKKQDPEALANYPVILYYGVKDPETGNMNYKRYDLTSDKNGNFTTELGVKPGQTIDEVKIQATLYVDADKPGKYTASATYNKTTKKNEESSTIYYIEVSKTNLTAGQAYFYDVNLIPSAYTSNPDLQQPGEVPELKE